MIASLIALGLQQLERLEHLEPLEQICSVYILICLIIAWVSGLLSSNNVADIV